MNPEQQIARRRRRTLTELRQIAAELASSGMSVTEFCRSRGLPRTVLYRALRQARNEGKDVRTSGQEQWRSPSN
jgi:transposase-like protein